MNKFLISTITVIGLSACAADDPNRRAKIGAGVGAAIGAIIGSKNNSDDALKGAVIGGALGVGIGVYMDRQAAELRKELGNSGVTVNRDGNNIVLNMPENVTFDSGKSVIKTQFQPVMADVARVFKKYNDTNLVIAGHTDSSGSNSLNQALSENRATAVKSRLTANGVGNSRVNTVGYGESSPIASNNSQEGKTQNRRVEITIVANKS